MSYICLNSANVPSSNISPFSPLDDNNTPSKDAAILPAYSTVDLVDEDPADDPWDLPELRDTGVKWSGEAAHDCQCTMMLGQRMS